MFFILVIFINGCCGDLCDNLSGFFSFVKKTSHKNSTSNNKHKTPPKINKSNFAFNSEGEVLIATTTEKSNEIVISNITKHKNILTISSKIRFPQKITVNHNGTKLAYADSSNANIIVACALAHHEVGNEGEWISLDSKPTESRNASASYLEFSPSSNYLAVMTLSLKLVEVYKIEKSQLVRQYNNIFEDNPYRLVFKSDTVVFVFFNNAPKSKISYVELDLKKSSISLPSEIEGVEKNINIDAVCYREEYLYVALSNQTINIYKLDNKKFIQSPLLKVEDFDYRIDRLTVDEQQNYLYCTRQDDKSDNKLKIQRSF